MRVWKLVSGIISIVLFFLIMLEACGIGFLEVYGGTGTFSSVTDTIFAIFLFAAGIVSIAVHNGGRGGGIALTVLYLIALIFALIGALTFDIIMWIWAVWVIICLVLAIVSIFRPGTKKNE